MRMDTRTITLRLTVASRSFSVRHLALDKAMGDALAGAEAELIRWGFRAIKKAGEIMDEGPIEDEFEAGVEEARRQSRPDDVT